MKIEKHLRFDAVLREKGMTKAELGKRMGKSPQHIYNVCTERSSVSMRALYDYASAIGCRACELIADYE